MQSKKTKRELLPAGVVIIGAVVLGMALFVFGRAYSVYISKPKSEREFVLGAKDSVKKSKSICNSSVALSSRLKSNNVLIPLYAPDSETTFNVSEIASCIKFPRCGANVSCTRVGIKVETTCIESYLRDNELNLTENTEIKGEGKTAIVRQQDWVVSNSELAKQMALLLERELTYCSLTDQVIMDKVPFRAIVVPVTDILPSAQKGFAKRFIEIDQSKEKMYLWQDGIYQEYRLTKGSEIGEVSLKKRKDFDLSSILGTKELEFVLKATDDEDWIILHE